jgi:UDP-glucosyltransferase BX8/BX9
VATTQARFTRLELVDRLQIHIAGKPRTCTSQALPFVHRHRRKHRTPMAAADGRSPAGHRVVMFPFPSHMNPMLQLAGLLRARGLAVTVLHTEFNAPDPALHPEFAFVSIRESLPREVVVDNADMVSRMMGFNAACEAPFQAALEALLLREKQEGLRTCAAVVDGQWYAMLGAARRAGIPALAMRPEGAATFLTMLATPWPRGDSSVPVAVKGKLCAPL